MILYDRIMGIIIDDNMDMFIDNIWPWVTYGTYGHGWLFTSINPIYFDVNKRVPWF